MSLGAGPGSSRLFLAPCTASRGRLAAGGAIGAGAETCAETCAGVESFTTSIVVDAAEAGRFLPLPAELADAAAPTCNNKRLTIIMT